MVVVGEGWRGDRGGSPCPLLPFARTALPLSSAGWPSARRTAGRRCASTRHRQRAEGFLTGRGEAARLAGIERQALSDAALRYNAEGPEGLDDRPGSGRPEALTPGQQAARNAWVCAGPARSGTGSAPGGWSTSAPMPRRPTARATASGACRGCSDTWGCHARKPGLAIPRAVRSSGPRSKKLGASLASIAQAHPQARLQLWCEDG